MNQKERLDYLVAAFKEDSADYKWLRVENDEDAKRTALRSLMNIRMPKPLPAEVLAIQDEYLRARAEERGIVTRSGIPTIREQYGSCHSFADKISIWQGDITLLAVDAIVNAANSQMLGCFRPMHACMDNCIHSFAGVQLRAACSEKMDALRQKYGQDYEQPTAIPMLTDAYNLPARSVIHVVGPIVYEALTPELEQNLADCYRNVLDLCREHDLKSVAFCCISTGVFRFPNKRAAEIAVETATDWLSAHQGVMERVIFNVFKETDKACYEKLLR